MLKRVLSYLADHFLIRNLIFAFSGVILLVFLINLLLGYYTRHGERLIVPDFGGKSVSQAQTIGDLDQLQIVVIDSLFVKGKSPGVILDQSPKPSSTVKSGRKIFVVINSEQPRMEYIPYVAGYSLRQAKNLIENSGFLIEKIVYRTDDATNNVLSQSYKGQNISSGSQLKAILGSSIVLTVGRKLNSPLPQVPKVVGLTLMEARSRLWEMGLNVGELRLDGDVKEDETESARIYKQVPNQQMRADYGAPIRLYLTRDDSKVSSGVKESDDESRRFVEVDSVMEYVDFGEVSLEDM
ncbi:MAG: PASTA domain-containing protein [Rikenellaceae bacterium]